MSVTIKVRRKDEFYRGLKATVPAIDAELRKALASAGDDMVEKARSFVPVDDGDLKQSIKWEFTQKTQDNPNRSPAITVQAGADHPNDPAFHARWVEFGTKAHVAGGMFAGATIPSVMKQPYFFPAYRILRKSIRGRLTRAMTKALKAAGFGKK